MKREHLQNGHKSEIPYAPSKRRGRREVLNEGMRSLCDKHHVYAKYLRHLIGMNGAQGRHNASNMYLL